MRRSARRKLLIFAWLVGWSSMLGPFYGMIFFTNPDAAALLQAAVDGVIGGVLMWGAILYLWPSRFFAPARRLPFPWRLAILVVLVGAIIPVTASISASINARAVVISFDFGSGWSLFFYVLTFSVVSLAIFQVIQMLGLRVFGSMLVGRYHEPKEEKRVFLFIDLVDSTRLTKELGDLGFQRLLTRFFFDIGQPVAEHAGEIHAYIGDEVIITWPFDVGVDKARCVRCFFAINDMLIRNAKKYQEKFGVSPRIRAGLHGGRVIVSECGDTRKSIVYFGDVMNTTARLESEAKRVKCELLASVELLDCIDLPENLSTASLGSVTLKGHDKPTALASIAPAI